MKALNGHYAVGVCNGYIFVYGASANRVRLKSVLPQPTELKNNIRRAVIRDDELLLQGFKDKSTFVYRLADLSPVHRLPPTDDFLLAVLPSGTAMYRQQQDNGEWCVRIAGGMKLLMPGCTGQFPEISACGSGGGNVAVTDQRTAKLRVFSENGELLQILLINITNK